MNQLQGIKNYLVIQNGTIICHKCNDQVEINDNKIIVDNASSLQIIYLIDQEGKYSIDLTIKGSLELIETYDLKTNATLVKNIEISKNANVLRYADNQSDALIQTKVIENVKVERDGNVKCAYVELAANSIEMEINYALIGENASATIRLAALARNVEKKHITLSLVHEAPYTTGIMDNYGVVKNQAGLVIDGIGTIKKLTINQAVIKQIRLLYLIKIVKLKLIHTYTLMNMMLKLVMVPVLVKLMKSTYIIYSQGD